MCYITNIIAYVTYTRLFNKITKDKIKVLIVVPGLLGLNIIILFLPYILVHFKSVI